MSLYTIFVYIPNLEKCHMIVSHDIYRNVVLFTLIKVVLKLDAQERILTQEDLAVPTLVKCYRWMLLCICGLVMLKLNFIRFYVITKYPTLFYTDNRSVFEYKKLMLNRSLHLLCISSFIVNSIYTVLSDYLNE